MDFIISKKIYNLMDPWYNIFLLSILSNIFLSILINADIISNNSNNLLHK